MAKPPVAMNTLRIPPHDLEAEQAVLGALMLRPAAIHDIVDLLVPEMFYARKHSILYKTIMDLSNKNEPIDVLSVASKLKEKKSLDEIGGNAYLNELMGNVPSTVNIRHYADIVYKKYVLRSLIDASENIATIAYDQKEMEVTEILDTAEKSIFRISSGMNVKHAFVSIKTSLMETMEQTVKLSENKDEIRGVKTGYDELDNLTAGLQKSDLIILAARPSMGKTTFALDMARNVALSGTPVGIFSLEMSAQQLVQRMLSAESRVDAWSIRTGHGLSAHHFTALQEAASRLQKAPIFIDDQAGNSIVKMRSVARRLKSEHGLGLIVIDYLQLMTTSKNYDNYGQPGDRDFPFIETAGSRARCAGIGICHSFLVPWNPVAAVLVSLTCVTLVLLNKTLTWSCSFTVKTVTRNSMKKITLPKS